ncbi:type II toxin-antitoxin system RelE/ParE family toxin [Galbibacter sp. BG1]|uniref:type II toxin-antitoxin system RelE/ParE family toxin n=1 Tax=Galbibacter sp. BG1 TaxID=1170699 RepID=UPI0015C1350C|nr:type II toxin-antitoxin system RelE/ParE family toxin [Galbibacter sp. BG1]QLE01453.1 type II toxin-antitoxin system RelE/ParE family toxin [Galbibacter sp. BG1]
MVQINWTYQAKFDIKNIASYIAKDSKRYAKLQVDRLIERVKILSIQPYSGKIVPEIDKENIRELIEGNYRIIYKVVTKNRIDILTVHHTARDLYNRKIT